MRITAKELKEKTRGNISGIRKWLMQYCNTPELVDASLLVDRVSFHYEASIGIELFGTFRSTKGNTFFEAICNLENNMKDVKE